MCTCECVCVTSVHVKAKSRNGEAESVLLFAQGVVQASFDNFATTTMIITTKNTTMTITMTTTVRRFRVARDFRPLGPSPALRLPSDSEMIIECRLDDRYDDRLLLPPPPLLLVAPRASTSVLSFVTPVSPRRIPHRIVVRRLYFVFRRLDNLLRSSEAPSTLLRGEVTRTTPQPAG